ncbi:MAG: DUF86 domain-containing protein [Planctomycetes bacterium]|nr:DUF86 domain-containing protein [Planctomycetota bacterium]
MPRREWLFRVQDMLEALARIREYTAALDEDSFRSNRLVVDAVLRNIATLGEAASAVPAEVRERHAQVPWQKLVSMRNVLVHEYFGISLEVVWKTVAEDLPPLSPMLADLLRAEGRR